MKKIYFVTNNNYKFQIAREAFKNFNFQVLQRSLNTPEIQSDDLGEIASFSVDWAAKTLNSPVFLTDAGCFVDALNGFPGPFIKYINKYFTAQDFLNLMREKKNRKVVFKECLAYCEPDKKPILFFSSASGTIAYKAGKKGKTPINEVFIPQGFELPASENKEKDMVVFWSKTGNFTKLAEFLQNKN